MPKDNKKDIEPISDSIAAPKVPKSLVLVVLAILSVTLVLGIVFNSRDAELDPLDNIEEQSTEDAEREEIQGVNNNQDLVIPEFDSAQGAQVNNDPLNINDAANTSDFEPPALGFITPSQQSVQESESYLERLRAPKVVEIGSPSTSQDTSNAQAFDIDQLGDFLDEDPLNIGQQNSQNNEGFLNIPDLNTESLSAGFLNDLEFTLLETTLIPIVIYQEINSQLPGKLNGTVTEDVWSANGTRILIPRYSRVMGQYQSAIQQGESRVFIIWNRILDPHGIDIRLNSSTVDEMGASGIEADINTHFWKRFGGSFLVSIIGGATQAESENDNQRQALAQSFNSSSEIALENSISIQPTAEIDAAQVAYISVNQDINFRTAYLQALARKQAVEQQKSQNLNVRYAHLISDISERNEKFIRELSQPVSIPTFVHPAPHSLGRVPERLRQFTEDDFPQIDTIETADEIALEDVATETVIPGIQASENDLPIEAQAEFTDTCPNSFHINIGKLLSQVVGDYLDSCGFYLSDWIKTEKDMVLDYQFRESASIELPNGIEDLIALLKIHYLIDLFPKDEGGVFFEIKALNQTRFSIGTH